jgi:hypothetical protein
VGFPFAKFFAVLTAVAPVVLMAVPGGAALTSLIPIIVSGIAEAQQKPGATGPEKKAYVLKLVASAAAGIEVVKSGTVDPALIEEAAGHAIDAVITTVHAVAKAHEDQPDSLPPLVPIPT